MWVLACVANRIVIKRQQSLAGDALKSHLPEDRFGLCTNKRESLNYKAMELFSDNVASLTTNPMQFLYHQH